MLTQMCGWAKRFRMNCHSIRDFFLAILLVSTISMTVLYELSPPWVKETDSEADLKRGLTKSVHNKVSRQGDCLLHRKIGRLKGGGISNGLLSEENKTDILARVKQIEERILGVEASRLLRSRHVIVRGSREVVEQELPVYEPVLQKHGFVLQMPRWYRGHGTRGGKESGALHVHVEAEGSPSMLFLMGEMDTDMPQSYNRSSRHVHYTKVNQIPPLLNTLTPRENFCRAARWARDRRVEDHGVFSPSCFILPQHQEELLVESRWNRSDSIWRVEPTGTSQASNIRGSWLNYDSLNKLVQRGSQAAVVQSCPHPLLVLGCGVVMRVYVLVTSVRPLRAYCHSHTTVHLHCTNQTQPLKIWTGDQWVDHIYDTHGQTAVSQLTHSLHSSVTRTLLLGDSLLGPHDRYPGSFQLLEMDVTFNSTFHAFILEVRGVPRVELLSSWSAYVNKQHVVSDVVAMLAGQASAASDVSNLVTAINLHISSQEGDCGTDTESCVPPSLVEYLLESRRESQSLGGFVKLYPTREADEFLPLVSHLWAVTNPASSPAPSTAPYHAGVHVHSLLVNAERFYSSAAAQDSDAHYDDLNIPMSNEEESSTAKDHRGIQESPGCSKDKSKLPYLSALHFSPPLTLTPGFQAVTSEYRAIVDYSTLILQVWAVADSCYCEARLEDKYGMARPSNVTLGIGNNKITVFVVDLSHGDPWVINTYSVVVYRRGPGEGLGTLHRNTSHRVCAIRQDCSLKYAPKDPCGLQEDPRFDTWFDFLLGSAELPPCDSGDVPGAWYVPCERCHQGALCHWQEAVWQPPSCRHIQPSPGDVQTCFTGKKILFIGDSTTRGMFHYLAEGVNGSLTEWDKTHNLKVYHSLNTGKTLLGFAYYPQFWFPENHRPVFEDALYQLVKRTGPLSNTSDTVLVVGGVHWLSTHHINVVTDKLSREGLTGITVIIKGLGSGFHQPVQGLHCLSKSEHEKLLHRNRVVTGYARRQGFHVLETFNMTMSRYKDFLQGKCACHFHRVSPVHQGQKAHTGPRKAEGPLLSPDGHSPHSQPQTYRVEGEINKVYSQILINMICHHHPYSR